MESAPQQNSGLKSTTTVTISMLNAESTAESSKKLSQPTVSKSTAKNQLIKERDTNANQIKLMKAAAENYKFLLAEKEKTLTDLNVSIQLLKQSFRPLDDKIQAAKRQVQEKREGELDLLRQKIQESADWEENYNEVASDYKRQIDGKNASLLANHKSKTDECDALRRRYETEVENTKASLKELNAVHKQALAEHAKLSDEKKFQLDRMELLKQQFNQMRDQFEQVAAERTAFTIKSNQLGAQMLQLDELVKQERESATLLKIEDNKRNLALRTKQISDAVALRAQKNKTLASQETKLKKMMQERDSLADERKTLENSFNQMMEEQEKIAAEIESKQADLENMRRRTEEFEMQMNEKLAEARRMSDCYSGQLIREMDGVRRKSEIFVDLQKMKKHAKKKENERSKEELRNELQSLSEMMEVLKQGHQLEMDTKQRLYTRKERDLEMCGESEKKGNEYEIELIKSNIEKLGDKRNTNQADFDEQQAELKKQVESLRRKLEAVKLAADASKAISENKHQAEVTMKLVLDLEREINVKKAKYMEMHKEVFELKYDMSRKELPSEFDPEAVMISQPIEIANSPIVQSPDEEIALSQAQDRMPKLDGPVTKFYEQRGNGQVLEQVSVAGAAANFTTQTLSKVATDSNPANYHVETQQMQMTRPGFDSNSDCTTKFRKVVYSGRGIDMNVMNEAKRILEIHQQGVTREADETEEGFKLRKVLVKRAIDLQNMMENSEFVQNSSMPSDQVLKPKEKRVEEEMTRAQAIFAQITQLVTPNQHPVVCDLHQTLTRSEADLHRDGQNICNVNVRKHGAGKK